MNIQKSNKLDFTNQDIYVGIDVHKKSWTVSIHLKEFEHRTFTQPPDVKILVNYLRRNFPNGNYYSVYEAGCFGYNIHSQLVGEGIKNIITNPADVPTKDKERKKRRDRIDARKLARTLKNGELEGIYIPNRENLEDRSLVRIRE
jgi:hypothetical protein